VNRLNRTTQFGSRTLAEPLLVARSQMRNHVMMCGVLAVLVSLKSFAADLSRTVLLARASDLAQPLRLRSNL
jgi:hypothetical protein